MTSQAAELPAFLGRAATAVTVARERVLAVRPLYVLSGFVVLQWLALVALALTVRHNGWVYYMGGDQLWHYTGAYLLVHGKLAPTYVGIGWSTILAPIAAIAGPNLVSALPAIILFNTLILVPLGVLCMYGIGERIGGRLFGYWTALLWILIPFVGIPYALHGYHQKWTELTMPQLLGLGAMSDYPSMIALAAGAYLCLRSLDERHWIWPAGAGFAVGYAFSVKPSNFVFLVAPVLLFVLFRLRALVPFALGLVPCLAALAFWKVKGQGNLPWRTTETAHPVAIGPGTFTHRYLRDNSWVQLHNNLLQLREFLWSDRLLEFLVIAGVIALIVRSRRGAVLIGVWFTVFLLLKGTYVNARVEDSSFWRLLMPAFPAFVVLAASVVLLVPGLRARPGALRVWQVPKRFVVGVATALVAVLALFPIALVAATKPIRGPHPAAFNLYATLVPQTASLQLRGLTAGGDVHLRWRPTKPSPGKVFYTVWRYPGPSDVACGPVRNAPDSCGMYSLKLGATRATRFVDHPGKGTWTYRVGITVNWLNSEHHGDPYVFSRPVTASVG